MASAGKMADTVLSGFVVAVLLLAGCQGQRAQAPAAGPEPVGSVPVRASRSTGILPVSSMGVPPMNLEGSHGQDARATHGRDAHATKTPDGVTTSEAKKVQAETGKSEPSGPAVELLLKFVPGEAATYRVTTESYKSVEWKGSAAAKPAQFTDGRTGSHVEFTFEQRVLQVQDDGAAGLEITIRGVKEAIESVNKVVLDFDSARPQDANKPMAALVGKSYRVKMSPKGQVVEISNVEPVRQAVQGSLPEYRVATRLLTDDEIRTRHEVAALSALQDSSARPGQTWSSTRSFSFDELGAKTYERVYTLKDVGCAVHTASNDDDKRGKSADGEGVHGTPYVTGKSAGRLAIVEMKAIPSSVRAEYQRQTANPLAKMSDNADSYEGRMVFDLDRGQVREYVEQMQNEWIIADPTSIEKGQPTAIRMAARRLHRLERVP